MRDDYPKEWEGIVDSGPERIDRWLHKNLAGFSMSAVREMIKTGKVRVNGRRVKKGRRVKPEDMRGSKEAVAAG
jgi:ribosomal 50S subunit-recycling heat shock protein